VAPEPEACAQPRVRGGVLYGWEPHTPEADDDSGLVLLDPTDGSVIDVDPLGDVRGMVWLVPEPAAALPVALGLVLMKAASARRRER